VRRALLSTLVVPALVLVFAGCGSDDEPDPTPTACLTDPNVWLTALEAAPGEVRLEGTTPISGCLPADQPAGLQAEVGRIAVSAATVLAAGDGKGDEKVMAGRGEAHGEEAAVRAGYLVGAIERGAEGTQGINATLVDRVESAATNFLGDDQDLHDAYRQGYEAGLESG